MSLYSYNTHACSIGVAMNTFVFGNRTIPYTLKTEPTLKSVKIAVDLEQGAVVRVPQATSQGELERVLHQKGAWIVRQLKQFEEIAPSPLPRDCVEGEKFAYLGRWYRLVIREEDKVSSSLELRGKRFWVTVSTGLTDEAKADAVRGILLDWLKTQAAQHLPPHVDHYAERLQVFPIEVVIKDQLKRWGSCTKRHVLNLNWKLVMAPTTVIDYVIVHELAHLVEPNHSPDFWRVVERVLPDYIERREWLRINGPKLMV